MSAACDRCGLPDLVTSISGRPAVCLRWTCAQARVVEARQARADASVRRPGAVVGRVGAEVGDE